MIDPVLPVEKKLKGYEKKILKKEISNLVLSITPPATHECPQKI